MRPRDCATRLSSSMSVGSCMELTGGAVSVCTKSVLVATVVVGACVVVMVGMGGAVDSVAVVGTVFTFFLVWQAAAASTAAMTANPNANDFTALLIVPPSRLDDTSSFVGRSSLVVTATTTDHQRAH